MREADIRLALLAYLEDLYAGDPETLVLEEVSVCHGQSRVDLAVVSGSFHGFEIKSQQDTLSRLPTQLRDYGSVFDGVTFVIGLKHLAGLLRQIPSWCGVMLASVDAGTVSLDHFRVAQANLHRDPYRLAQLLWRDEAVDILQRHGHLRGVKSKPREALWRRLAEALGLDDLAFEVRAALRARKSRWKGDSRARLLGTLPRAEAAKKKPRRRSTRRGRSRTVPRRQAC